jgi:hypothetical protein
MSWRRVLPRVALLLLDASLLAGARRSTMDELSAAADKVLVF